MSTHRCSPRRGFSFLEFLAVTTIVGIIAAIVVPRVTVSSATAKEKIRDHHTAAINAAVEKYYIETNVWPADDLSDIGGDPKYFPEGLPTNPVDDAPYALDSATHQVKGPIAAE